jgi:hypothetical protein
MFWMIEYFTESASAFTNGEETTNSIISKNAFKFILHCLRPLECNEKNQIRFLMKGEKIVFKENIPAFSVQGKSRSISVLQKNLVTITQKISIKLTATI